MGPAQQGSSDRGVRNAFGSLTASAQVPWGPSPLTSVLRTGNSSRLWYDFPCCRAGEVSGSQFRPRHTATRRSRYCAENHDAAFPADQTRNRCSDMPRRSCGGTSMPERPRAPHKTSADTPSSTAPIDQANCHPVGGWSTGNCGGSCLEHTLHRPSRTSGTHLLQSSVHATPRSAEDHPLLNTLKRASRYTVGTRSIHGRHTVSTLNTR